MTMNDAFIPEAVERRLERAAKHVSAFQLWPLTDLGGTVLRAGHKQSRIQERYGIFRDGVVVGGVAVGDRLTGTIRDWEAPYLTVCK